MILSLDRDVWIGIVGCLIGLRCWWDVCFGQTSWLPDLVFDFIFTGLFLDLGCLFCVFDLLILLFGVELRVWCWYVAEFLVFCSFEWFWLIRLSSLRGLMLVMLSACSTLKFAYLVFGFWFECFWVWIPGVMLGVVWVVFVFIWMFDVYSCFGLLLVFILGCGLCLLILYCIGYTLICWLDDCVYVCVF